MAKGSIRREELRLKKALLPLLLLAAGVPLACSIGDGATTSSAALDNDGTTGKGTDGRDGGSTAPNVDLDAGGCQPVLTTAVMDSGTGDCAEFRHAECGLPREFESISDTCNLTLSQCFTICQRMMRPCHVYGDACRNGMIVPGVPLDVECAICPGSVGRRPEGFCPEGVSAKGTPPLGAFFAELARLEAASIDAFDRLRDELELHRAPAELVLAAERARQDEIAHSRTMARLARKHGGQPLRVVRAPRSERPLAEIARENMVEGCVRETFGAAVAAWQATHSSDPDVKLALEKIARDELRHAALSWAVGQWAASLLDDTVRSDIAAAQAAAIGELEIEADRPLHPLLVSVGGLPAPEVQKQMIAEMRASVWAA